MHQSISKKEILELKTAKAPVKLIDIRTPAEYEKVHIESTVNIPAEILDSSTSIFAQEDIIVCICNKGHERSQNAAAVLSAKGFTNVFYLEGGTLGWLAE